MAILSISQINYTDLFNAHKRHFNFLKEYINTEKPDDIKYFNFVREEDGKFTYSIGLHTLQLRATIIPEKENPRIIYSTVELALDIEIIGQEKVITMPDLDFVFYLNNEGSGSELTISNFTSGYLKRVESVLYKIEGKSNYITRVN